MYDISLSLSPCLQGTGKDNQSLVQIGFKCGSGQFQNHGHEAAGATGVVKSCEDGARICGIRTRIQSDTEVVKDKLGVVDVVFKCCAKLGVKV